MPLPAILSVSWKSRGETMADVFNGRLDLRFNICKGLTFTTTNGADYYDAKGYSFGSKGCRPRVVWGITILID